MRTLFQAGRLDNVKQEMGILGIDILGISETRWIGAGIFKSEKNIMLYSGGCKHERGVGIIFDENTARCLLGYSCVSDRVMIIKLNAKPLNKVIMQEYMHQQLTVKNMSFKKVMKR